MIVILMGVSGSGKTTTGKVLAGVLGWDFYDADDFHPIRNIAKMSQGLALNDEDRRPWLEALRGLILDSLQKDRQAVIACSALKETYRSVLRVNQNVQIVYLKGTFEQIERRLSSRRGHFMNTGLLADQFATLQEPGDALPVDISLPPEQIADRIRKALNI